MLVIKTITNHKRNPNINYNQHHLHKMDLLLNSVSLYLQFNLRVGIIGVAYLVGMSMYTIGSIIAGLR